MKWKHSQSLQLVLHFVWASVVMCHFTQKRKNSKKRYHFSGYQKQDSNVLEEGFFNGTLSKATVRITLTNIG